MAVKNGIASPKGTRDFYPDRMRIQRHLFDAWRKVCEAYGYQEYEGPMFEHLELFTRKSGEEIVEQLYAFQDKGGRDIALRPELTPTLARMVNQRGPSLKLPLKWYSVPRLFRYERMQKGRLREFYQLNMDIIGAAGIWAEVDLLSAIIEMLRMLGLKEEDFSIRLSSRRVLADFLGALGLSEEQKPMVYAALDKKAKVSEEAFSDMLQKAGLTDEAAQKLQMFFNSRSLQECRQAVYGEDLKASLDELQSIFSQLESLGYGPFVELDLGVVRGLAYYTGPVFEVFDRGKRMRAIAGGGRYDSLLESLGGRPLTGVGFGMGDVVLQDMLEEKGLLPDSKGNLDYFLVSFSEPQHGMFRLAQQLRDKGYKVAHALEGSKMKKQLSLADDMGARKVLFYGSDQAPEGKFEVKDLSTGEQGILGLEEL